MARSKHSKPDEFFAEQIRKLKSENKALKKRLRQLEKNEHIIKELKLDLEADQEIARDEALKPKGPQYEICDNCFRRGLETVKIVNRIFKSCTLCDWRSKAVVNND